MNSEDSNSINSIKYDNNLNIDSNNGQKSNKTVNTNDKLLGILLMGSLTGAGLIFGFSSALALAKKRDTTAFSKGLLMLNKGQSPESGASLAMRALGWGSLYACSGFALFCLVVWKGLAVNNLQEFRSKVGNLLPKIPRNEPPKSRTEFSSLRDLLQYIIEESDKSNDKKK